MTLAAPSYLRPLSGLRRPQRPLVVRQVEVSHRRQRQSDQCAMSRTSRRQKKPEAATALVANSPIACFYQLPVLRPSISRSGWPGLSRAVFAGCLRRFTPSQPSASHRACGRNPAGGTTERDCEHTCQMRVRLPLGVTPVRPLGRIRSLISAFTQMIIEDSQRRIMDYVTSGKYWTRTFSGVNATLTRPIEIRSAGATRHPS